MFTLSLIQEWAGRVFWYAARCHYANGQLNVQWSPFPLARPGSIDSQNAWTGRQFRVNYNVFAQGSVQASIDGCGKVIQQIKVPVLVFRSSAMYIKLFFHAYFSQFQVLIFEKPELKDQIVINPQWLLQKVIGALMAPSMFHGHSPIINYDHGRVSREDMLRCLEPFAEGTTTAEVILDMVAQLGLSIIDEDAVVVPSKLDIERDSEYWGLSQRMEVYLGRRLQSKHNVPVAASFFPQLQVYLYNYFVKNHNQTPQLWSGGMLIVEMNSEAMLEMRRDKVAIDIMVRGWAGSQRSCYVLLQWLIEETLLMAGSLSPGSELEEFVLSSMELKTKGDQSSREAPRVAYTKKSVENAMAQGLLINDPRLASPMEDPVSLLAVPADHVDLLPTDCLSQFCRALEQIDDDGIRLCDWRGLGYRLGIEGGDHRGGAPEMATQGQGPRSRPPGRVRRPRGHREKPDSLRLEAVVEDGSALHHGSPD